jgi:hypothetical protein
MLARTLPWISVVAGVPLLCFNLSMTGDVRRHERDSWDAIDSATDGGKS